MKKHVYSFGGGTADGDGTMKDTLGGKGAGLAEMCRANCRCLRASPSRRRSATSTFENKNQVPERDPRGDAATLWKSSQKQMEQKLGDTENPLLVSVRSGAKFSMPGMMDTILNLGLNDETVVALEHKSGNPRFA